MSFSLRDLFTAPSAPSQPRAAVLHASTLIQEVMASYDAAFVAYLVERQMTLKMLLPKKLHGAAITWLVSYADVMTLTEAERLEAVRRVRLDLMPIVETEPGKLWLQKVFTLY